MMEEGPRDRDSERASGAVWLIVENSAGLHRRQEPQCHRCGQHFSYQVLCIISSHEVGYDLVPGRLQALPGTAGDDFVHACGRDIVLPVGLVSFFEC